MASAIVALAAIEGPEASRTEVPKYSRCGTLEEDGGTRESQAWRMDNRR